MATKQKTAFVTGDPSITQLAKRTIEDKIRHLIPEHSKLFSLVADGQSVNGEVVKKAGLISKKSAVSTRVEAYTHTPPEIVVTATSVSDLDITVPSALDFTTRQVWRNTRNNTIGCVDKISGTTISFISFGATFTVTAGDVLMRIGYAYEGNSEDPSMIQTPDDNVYNVMQIMRAAVEISASKKAIKHEAGGDYFERMKKYTFIEYLRDAERALIWGQRPSTTTTNFTTMTELGTTVRHSRGMWNFAQASYDVSGGMTPSKLRKDLILAMDPSVRNNEKLIFFVSQSFLAEALEWQDDKYMIMKADGGTFAKFGIKSHTFSTSGPDIEMVNHDAFNYGSDTGKGLLISPEDWQYRYLEGRDIKPVSNIQEPSQDGFKDEIKGEFCLLPLAGGYKTTKVTNLC